MPLTKRQSLNVNYASVKGRFKRGISFGSEKTFQVSRPLPVLKITVVSPTIPEDHEEVPEDGVPRWRGTRWVITNPSPSPTESARSTDSIRRTYITEEVPDSPDDDVDWMMHHTPTLTGFFPTITRGLQRKDSLEVVKEQIFLEGKLLPEPEVEDVAVSPRTYTCLPTETELAADERARRPRNPIVAMKRRETVLGKVIKVYRRVFPIVKVDRPPRGSKDTLALDTEIKQYRQQATLLQRAQSTAIGVGCGVRAMPAAGASLIKSASTTGVIMKDKLEDTKDRFNAVIPAIRPTLQQKFSFRQGDDRVGCEDSNISCLGEPGTGLVPPTPAPKKAETEQEDGDATETNSPPLIREPFSTFLEVPQPKSDTKTMERKGSLMSEPPFDAILTPALVSDVSWQAKHAEDPVIIITEETNTDGSWYLPTNAQGQVRFSFAPPPPTPSPGNDFTPIDIPTGQVNSSEGTGTSLSYVHETQGLMYEGGRAQWAVVNSDERTPLLVEILSADELAARAEELRNMTGDKVCALVWV